VTWVPVKSESAVFLDEIRPAGADSDRQADDRCGKQEEKSDPSWAILGEGIR
jgi:hypothetical protein